MCGLSAEVTQSWFVAKAAVRLVPVVTLGAADVIGWFVRRTHWRRKKDRGSVGTTQGRCPVPVRDVV